MLIEYRILLPLSVDEYKIAQLYMIQKKSRLDSSGKGSCVEIIKNEPYVDGPGNSGQYTYKVFHIGSKIPGWMCSIMPSDALNVNEESWNAYPYTKTIYKCSLIERFRIEIETKYFNDSGAQYNVFNLNSNELTGRVIDVIDIVNDELPNHDYMDAEDPKLFRSVKSGRGPLSNDWISKHEQNNEPIMCAYKLCRVEFGYWGLQTKVEKWIHQYALRNTMLLAHRQAWAWQDEWVDLNIAQIRDLELKTAEQLSKIMSSDVPKKISSSTSLSTKSTSSESLDVFFDCIDTSSIATRSLININALFANELSDATNQQSDSDVLLLIIVFQSINIEVDYGNKVSDNCGTLKSTIENLVEKEYQQFMSRIHFISVDCSNEFSPLALKLLSINSIFGVYHPMIPILLSSSNIFLKAVETSIKKANAEYDHFKCSKIGRTFSGKIYAIGDYISGILLYEILKNKNSEKHAHKMMNEIVNNEMGGDEGSIHLQNLHGNKIGLDFRVNKMFLFGCPLALLLIQRKMNGIELQPVDCEQILNVYYKLDPCGARIEPILNPQLSQIHPINIQRYNKYKFHFANNTEFNSRYEISLLWGIQRIDYNLYFPFSISSLSSSVLPNVLHASYWENIDIANFIMKQFVQSKDNHSFNSISNLSTVPSKINLSPLSWHRKTTKFKVANLAPNHRANDVVVIEGEKQTINAKFCYGPMDLVSLSKEKISIYYCPPYHNDYQLLSTEITNSHGRLSFMVELPVGIHCVKAVIHGDHSFLDTYVAVVPHDTKFVVFSIDGSLTGSVSVSGRDPKIRAGAVDVVRFWHELGYPIIYITARPDMQERVVSTWLACHNFPIGLLLFTPSFSTDPLKQKTLHLRSLIDMGLFINAAYGSSKDIAVYESAGVSISHIFSISRVKRKNCTYIGSYSVHLNDLNKGTISFAQPIKDSIVDTGASFPIGNSRNFTTQSFAPRSGRYVEKWAQD